MAGNGSSDWKPASARVLDDDWKPASARTVDEPASAQASAKRTSPPSVSMDSTAEELRSAFLWAQSHKNDPRAAKILEFFSAPSTTTGQGPTLDAKSTGAFHFARHLSFGLGDKIIAAEAAARDALSGKTSFSDAYKRNLAFNDALLEASDVAHPTARWVGNTLGVGGSLAATALAAPVRAAGATGQAASQGARVAPTLSQLARQGVKLGGILGGVGSFGSSRSDSTLGTLGDVTLGAGLGAGLGAATPYGISYTGRYLGTGTHYLSDKARNLAGWLKLHTLRPTPTLAEKVADLPGGAVGVGKELLERGIGGLTNKGTAAQIETAKEAAGKAITKIATEYDALGKPKLNPSTAIYAGWTAARELMKQPTTEAAGRRLLTLMDKYESKFFQPGQGYRLITAAEMLDLKRAVAKAAYGASDQLHKTGDVVAGEFGAGLSKFERAIDATLDRYLGPEFEAANIAFRRLLGAGQAAERMAARTQGNTHIIGGLVPTIVGGSAMAAGHGGPEAVALGLGSSLIQKYGSQAGARLLYSPVAGGLNLADQALSNISPELLNIFSATASSQAGQAASSQAGQSASEHMWPFGEEK